MTFPTSLDSFPVPNPTDPLSSPGHASLHEDVGVAVEAVETKLGIYASTPDTDTVLAGTGTGTSEWIEGLPVPLLRRYLVEDYDRQDYPASPNATYDDEFDDTTGNSGPNNGLDARWNWYNQGAAAVSWAYPGYLTLDPPSQITVNWRILYINSIADGTYEAYVSLNGVVNEARGGICAIDYTNGDFYTIFLDSQDGQRIKVERWTNPTTVGANHFNGTGWPQSAYLRIIKNGTNLQFWASRDGRGWYRFFSVTDIVNVTGIGICATEISGSSGLTFLNVGYFRKVA